MEHAVFDESDLRDLKNMIGFRNVVGHDYISLDKQKVFSALESGVAQIDKICRKIAAHFPG